MIVIRLQVITWRCTFQHSGRMIVHRIISIDDLIVHRYHGFRYLQVEQLTYTPQANDLTSYTLRVNNDIAGTFNSSDELLN